MDYRPNVEGVAWFASEVWPLVRAGLPDAQFDVVGSRPARRITELAREPGINVTGRVDDVRGYLARARVSVAPLRIARGVQNKVLEAMAMAKPVVATPEAADGIEAEPGRDLVVAGDAQAFAASVLALLRDGSRAESIGRAARACVERHYRWDRNLAILDGVLG
jgi:glycosyltransferase involved in cell wall biosynthesis